MLETFSDFIREIITTSEYAYKEYYHLFLG